MPRNTATPEQPPTDLEAFTVQEVAQRLKVHEDFVYDRIRNGELGHIRSAGRKSAIRILPSQLQKYIQDRVVQA